MLTEEGHPNWGTGAEAVTVQKAAASRDQDAVR